MNNNEFKFTNEITVHSRNNAVRAEVMRKVIECCGKCSRISAFISKHGKLYITVRSKMYGLRDRLYGSLVETVSPKVFEVRGF